MELKISNLSKTYKNGVKALDDVSLTIKEGMFGLLGPNGAGKSTLMRIISTLQSPDDGSIMLDDIDVLKQKNEVRKLLGYLPQNFGVYPKTSAEILLDHIAALKGIADKSERKAIVEAVLKKTNLYEKRNSKLGGFSGGMKQRFGIAQLLLADPKLIIVDEPTAGLDPAERHRFLNLLREIGTSHIVILSTHIVDDVKELCTDMAIMNLGNILMSKIPSNAVNELKGKIWTLQFEGSKLEELEGKYSVLSTKFNEDNSMNIRILSDSNPDGGFKPCDPNLEDVYFATMLDPK